MSLSGRVLFSGHLLYLQHFLSSASLEAREGRAETSWLTHAVNNAWQTGGKSRGLQDCSEFHAP
jgi:hypothetical protein